MRTLQLLFVVLAVLGTGCSTYKSGLKTATTADASSAATDWDAAKALFEADRGSREAMEKIVAALEGVVTEDPNNQEALILLARSRYFLADGYMENGSEEKSAMFEAAVTAGEQAMAADPAFKAQLDKGVKPKDAVEVLQKDDQMAIYWTASALGKWARTQGFGTVVKYKNYIAGMMTKCLALDEAAYWGGPVRYWGAFYSVAPGFAGGDMDKSKEMYEKAIGMFPENFSTYVLYADTYATKAQEPELFERLLQQVIAGDPNSLPELVWEQKVEQKKAAALLARKGELFAN